MHPEHAVLPFTKKGGPHLWHSLLVLQNAFLPSSLITGPQCCSSSHVTGLMGWARIHLKSIRETPLLSASGWPTSGHMPSFWPNRHKGSIFSHDTKKKCKDKDLSPPVFHSYFCVGICYLEWWQPPCNHEVTSLWRKVNTLRLAMWTHEMHRGPSPYHWVTGPIPRWIIKVSE